MYRGLVDAVQSIVRTGGLKGLYQVSTFTTYSILSLVICLVVFVPHGAMQIIYLSFSLKALEHDMFLSITRLLKADIRESKLRILV